MHSFLIIQLIKIKVEIEIELNRSNFGTCSSSSSRNGINSRDSSIINSGILILNINHIFILSFQ